MVERSQPSDALISVIILNHNGAEIIDLVGRSAQAVLEQDYPAVELILVDDNSTDGSAKQVEALCGRVGAAFASTADGKHGISAARNLGLGLAHGEYIAFLDNDAIPQPRWLTTLVQPMLADSTIGACASRVMFADKPDIVNSMGSVLNELFHGNGVCIHEMFEFASWPEEVMYATGNGMILLKSAMDQVGPFDEGYPFYGPDDADYGMRLRRAGWRIAPAPDAVVHHLHSFSMREKGMPFWNGRNRIRMALKHQSWRELPRFIWRDMRYYVQPSRMRDYVRYWWSTLTDWDGLKGLIAYRQQHRGEPAYAAMFSGYFNRAHRLMVVPDNRAFGTAFRPLDEIRIGDNDEAYLYHGWYWVEHWGDIPMRWAMRVASLVCSLPDGASALRWRLLPRRGGGNTFLDIKLRRKEGDAYEELASLHIELKGESRAMPVEVVTPCTLAPGDYRIILVADDAEVESGFFPRQIGFGFAGLCAE
jgi:GT2 family glycosyltransferase